jgi:hypothetical protein
MRPTPAPAALTHLAFGLRPLVTAGGCSKQLTLLSLLLRQTAPSVTICLLLCSIRTQVEVSDAAMAVLAAHCTQLTSLRLEQTYVGDEGVQKLLAAFPLLQELRVAGCSTHSWMLPAEYMFAGLSVSGLSKMAAAPGIGAALTSLDLSCLAYEQPLAQPPAAAVMQESLLPGAVAAVTAAVAAAGEVPVAAVAAGSSVAASTAAALLSSSPTPSSSVGSSASSSAMIGSDDGGSSSSSSFTSVASAIARLSLDSSSSSSRCSSTSSSPVRRPSWDGSTSSSSSHLLQPMQPTTYTHQPGSSPSSTCSSVRDPGNFTTPQQSSPSPTAAPTSTDLTVHPPLIPVDWCGRLTSLSLDWLKVDGSMLQGPLEATLRACGSLKKLSLVGYSGDVDGLLGCVADAGAAVTQLGLQHSQVWLTDMLNMQRCCMVKAAALPGVTLCCNARSSCDVCPCYCPQQRCRAIGMQFPLEIAIAKHTCICYCSCFTKSNRGVQVTDACLTVAAQCLTCSPHSAMPLNHRQPARRMYVVLPFAGD